MQATRGEACEPMNKNRIVPDPLDKELEARGHKSARYADESPRGFGWRSVLLYSWKQWSRSRTQGGVGPVAGLTAGHGDPVRLVSFRIGSLEHLLCQRFFDLSVSRNRFRNSSLWIRPQGMIATLFIVMH